MTGPPTENGSFLLFLRAGTKIVGDVRIEDVDGVRRLEVTTPSSKGFPSRLAIIAPESVERCAPCTPHEAALMAAALRGDDPRPPPNDSDNDNDNDDNDDVRRVDQT